MTEHYDDTSQPMEKYLDDLAKEKPRLFLYEELKSSTFGFTKNVGHGGFGIVYQGELNGVKIAVKVLRENTNDVMRKQFMAEVSTMGRTFHPNLIKLYGYCFNANTKALVYEYVEHGSLDNILFKNDPEVEWEKLYGIAIEIAYGLSYLHEHCRPQIIHYDIKPDNVLIDSNFSPKIIDFGMARHSNQAEQSSYRGTSGYAAPEVGKGRHVTYKSDIYSFGMMMFEFLRRKRNSQGPGWFPGEVGERVENEDLNEIILDCGIKESDKENAERLCLLALWCTQQNHLKRPDMSSVVKMLQGEIPLRKPPNPFPFYDSSPQSSMFDARPLPKFSPAFSHGLPESSLTHKESDSSSASSKNSPKRESNETDLFDTRPEQNTSVQTEQKEVRFEVTDSFDSSKPGNVGEPRSARREQLPKFSPAFRHGLPESSLTHKESDSSSASSKNSPKRESNETDLFDTRPEQNTSVQTEQKEVRFEVTDSFDSSKPRNVGEPRSARREQLPKFSPAFSHGLPESSLTHKESGSSSASSKNSPKRESNETDLFDTRPEQNTSVQTEQKKVRFEVSDSFDSSKPGNVGEPRSSKANASARRELSEQLKKVSISAKPKSAESLLKSLEKRCPPGGENSVIVYTTTGGNREPFKDSNKIRSMLQSHQIQMFERDIYKDSLFREQLKELMGYIKVPLMFVKGGLVGGADEVMVMEENGDLGILFDGIPKLQEQAKTKPIPREPRSSKANASIQREPSKQLKKASISPKPRSSESLLESLEKRCPPGGGNSVILYTTTGGDREPFKDSNKVRSMLQSHYIQMFERDIFKDALFREQLKGLMGCIKVPLMFVKGRLVGGADEVMVMEENGDLGILFDGIPKLQEQAKTKPIPREPRSGKANASIQREPSEQLKKVSISPKPRSSESLLESLEKRCPPGGGNSVILYTTTGGDREPFKDSNKIRSMLQSHYIQMFERDIFKDALFREQLKGLMGYIKVPLMFVKGRLVGGADEVMVMEENGDLGILFDGIPKLQEQVKTKAIPREPRSSKANASIQRAPSEQLKKVSISPKPRSSESLLESLEKRCPPGGRNSVIVYTTTGGNREPFKDSNKVRSMLQSHYIQMFERDIFNDALYREQLKELMGYIKVPLLFVKGRLVGGADEVSEMEENGNLDILFDGIPKLQKQAKTKPMEKAPRSSGAVNTPIQWIPKMYQEEEEEEEESDDELGLTLFH